MIVKRSSRGADKPSSFRRLVRYITRADSPDKERPDTAWTVNCGVEDPALAACVVEATQSLNTRCRSDKTYHLIVSFAASDTVDPSATAQIEERLAGALGFAEHQRVCALHTDTEHSHLHIAINRIHPLTRRALTPRLDFRKLSREAAAIERDFGLARTHDHLAREGVPPERAAQMEAHSAQQSFASWIKAQIAGEAGAPILDAGTWPDLPRALALIDVRLQRRGASLVIVAGAGQRAKASAAHPRLSARALADRLGPFEPPANALDGIEPTHRYTAPPISAAEARSPLWKSYRDERQRSASERRKRFSIHRRNRSDLFTEAKDAWARQRELINGDRSLSRAARWRAFETLARERRR